MLDSFKKPLLRGAAACCLFIPALALSACGSDSDGNSGTAGKGSSSGGTSTTSGGSGGKSQGGDDDGDVGGTVSAGTTSGGTASGGNATAGTASGGKPAGGSASGGSASGGGKSGGGDERWACVEAGGSCICQTGAEPRDESVCKNEYPCCFTAPLGPVTRCQCQDPGQSKCSDFAGFTGGTVVTTCPPP